MQVYLIDGSVLNSIVIIGQRSARGVFIWRNPRRCIESLCFRVQYDSDPYSRFWDADRSNRVSGGWLSGSHGDIHEDPNRHTYPTQQYSLRVVCIPSRSLYQNHLVNPSIIHTMPRQIPIISQLLLNQNPVNQ